MQSQSITRPSHVLQDLHMNADQRQSTRAPTFGNLEPVDSCLRSRAETRLESSPPVSKGSSHEATKDTAGSFLANRDALEKPDTTLTRQTGGQEVNGPEFYALNHRQSTRKWTKDL